jgi:hypothetical protein
MASETFFRVARVGALLLLLSACTPIDRQQATSLGERQWQSRVRSWWAALTGTASGALSVTRGVVEGAVQTGRDTLEVGKQAVSEAQATVRGLGERVEKVKEGMEKFGEGKRLVEEGMGR